jgi:hypothetical protein
MNEDFIHRKREETVGAPDNRGLTGYSDTGGLRVDAANPGLDPDRSPKPRGLGDVSGIAVEGVP